MTTAKKKNGKGFSPFVIVLLSSLVLFGILMLLPTNIEQTNKDHLPWNAIVTEQGHVRALGIETHTHTVAEAQKLLKDNIEFKVFTENDGSNLSIEAYLPSIHIGAIHGAVVLKIDVSEQKMAEIHQRGIKTQINQAGRREISPYADDIDFLYQQTFTTITLIPRRNLSKEGILKRFGEPETKEAQADGLRHWFYPSKGLEILMDDAGKEALQYANPV